MFEIGWTEMLVIAVVMIVVVGPKDLPGMLRTFGKTDDEAALDGGRLPEAVQRRAQGSRARRRQEVGRRAAQPQSRQRDQEAAQSVRESRLRCSCRARYAETQATGAGLSGRGRRRTAQERGSGHARRCAGCRLSWRHASSTPVAVSGPVEPAPAPKPRKPRAAKPQAATTEAAKPKAAPRKKKSESSPT